MPGLVLSDSTFNVQVDAPAQYRAPERIDWSEVAADLAPIPCEASRSALRRKSRDFFWFSPVLKAQLDAVMADLIVSPRDEDELVRVARYCVAHGLPLTARGAGTGNYGQAMPLHGGIVLDLTGLAGVTWIRQGIVRALAGTRLFDLQVETLKHGLELRFHPSTWKTATLGGFVAGGSTGCGAINYGVLTDVGNVLGLRILTLEDEPRFIELRGRDVLKAIHAYGCNGIITQVEIALAPAVDWCDVVVCLPGAMDGLRLADAVARSSGVVAKLLTSLAWSAAKRMSPLRPFLIEGQAVLCAMVAQMSLESFKVLAQEFGGVVVHQRGAEDIDDDVPPLYELSFNHTTLHAMKDDAQITYLQLLIPGPDQLNKSQALIDAFGDEVPMHIELARQNGEVTYFGLHLVQYTTETRLNAIIDHCWALGCVVFNPHTFLLEAGGRPTADPGQFTLKRQSDPYGLLNPGKMPGWPAPTEGFFLRG